MSRNDPKFPTSDPEREFIDPEKKCRYPGIPDD